MSKRSGLALAVLSLLHEEPMHPYRMQQLIASRGRSQSVNISQRASLYSTIDRLARDGLIEVSRVLREGSRPEKSVYQITAAGRETSREWLGEMLSTPKQDFPEFVSAIAQVPLLEPEEVLPLLQQRRLHLEAEVEKLEDKLAAFNDHSLSVSVVQLDVRLILRHRETELAFVQEVVADIESGAMSWSRESLASLSAVTNPVHLD